MSESVYSKYSINKLIIIFSVPAIISLIIEMLTSVVDTSFAGHLGSQSGNALAAMGLLSPLLAVFVALQTLFAVSTAIMISRYLGRGDYLKLNQYFKTGFLMSVLVSVVASFVTYSFMGSILSLLGVNDKVYAFAHDYLEIILLSNIFSAIGYTLTSCIRAFGRPKVEAIIISLSVMLNVLFNAFFTFGLQLGMVGIALGTLVSEIICAFISIIYLRRKQLWFTSSKMSITEHLKISQQLFMLGFAQTTIQLLAGMTGFIMNEQLLSIGGHSQIAIWNIANKLYMLVLMPIIGITQGVQTIIAYFDGQNDEGKKSATVKQTIFSCFLYGIGITVLIFIFGTSVVSLFTRDEAILNATMVVIKVIFITFPLLGITYTIMTLLQVTGRELKAMILAAVRQVFVIIPLVFALPYIFQQIKFIKIDPAFVIFFAIPLADLITLVIVLFLIRSKK